MIIMFRICEPINGAFTCSKLLTRSFGSTHIKLYKYASREGRIIQRMMNGSLRKRKKWYSQDDAGKLPPTPTHVTFYQGSRNTKRIAVLNKLFMKNITDLMATGEVSDELVGHGIGISRVRVAADFSHVKVFWLAKGTPVDSNIEEILTETASALRHELSQLRVMGMVPKIEFVKDKQYAIIAEVDQLLAKADFGDDFVPEDPSNRIKTEFTLSTPLSPNIQEHIKHLESEIETPDDEPLPPMRNDVLGLNHSEIMNKIMKSLKKSQALHRSASVQLQRDAAGVEENLVSTNDTNHSDVHQQTAAMAKFIQTKQFMKQKEMRAQRNYQLERELLEREVYREDTDSLDDSLNYCEEDEKDFIQEEDIIEDENNNLNK